MTASVTLRAATDADADLLFRLAAELETWEERSPLAPTPLTRAAHDARAARLEAEPPTGDSRFVIDLDGVGVGTVSLFALDSFARHAEVGIALVAEARGKGVGTAAMEQIVEFGFMRCNLRRLHLEAITSNVGAIRAYEKAGFVVEGRRREHAWVRGGYEDVVLMGVLRAEWEGVSRT